MGPGGGMIIGVMGAGGRAIAAGAGGITWATKIGDGAGEVATAGTGASAGTSRGPGTDVASDGGATSSDPEASGIDASGGGTVVSGGTVAGVLGSGVVVEVVLGDVVLLVDVLLVDVDVGKSRSAVSVPFGTDVVPVLGKDRVVDVEVVGGTLVTVVVGSWGGVVVDVVVDGGGGSVVDVVVDGRGEAVVDVVVDGGGGSVVDVVGRVGGTVVTVVVGRVGGTVVAIVVVVSAVLVVPPTWARVGPGSAASTNQAAPAASTSPRRAAGRRGARCSATGGGVDAVPPLGSGAMPSRRKRRRMGYRRARAVKVEAPWASRALGPCQRATATAVVADSIGLLREQRQDGRLVRPPISTSRPPPEAPTGPSITQCIAFPLTLHI